MRANAWHIMCIFLPRNPGELDPCYCGFHARVPSFCCTHSIPDVFGFWKEDCMTGLIRNHCLSYIVVELVLMTFP